MIGFVATQTASLISMRLKAAGVWESNYFTRAPSSTTDEQLDDKGSFVATTDSAENSRFKPGPHSNHSLSHY
jgi:hypothetical protein